MSVLPFENDKSELVFFHIYGIVHRWTKKSFYSYTTAPRAYHGLMCILCEGIEVEYPDGSVVHFDQGDIIYMPKGIFYHIRFLGDSEPLEALMINFCINGDPTPCNEIKRVINGASGDLTDPFYKIAAFYIHADDHKYEIAEQFYRLLKMIKAHGRTEVRTSSAKKSVLPAIDHINDHVGEPIYVPELARMCLLSESAFRKRFKECYEKTPNAYLSEQRLLKAAELLVGTDIPLQSVATELGFYDTAYFCRLFKKRFGATPHVYRSRAFGT